MLGKNRLIAKLTLKELREKHGVEETSKEAQKEAIESITWCIG